jgi:hypothetical protein
MINEKGEIQIGSTPLNWETKPVDGNYIRIQGEDYYRITNSEQIPPFLMSLVSSSDHWLFIASNGGLTAGRTNADSALFPYETEDKIPAHNEGTGGKTILRVERDGRIYVWEPFSERYAGIYHCQRNLYKNIYGNKLIFEAINHDLQLTMRVAWRTGDRFGFIRTCWLQNDGDAVCQGELLDGLQNLLPYGATAALQSSFSSLLNAYKRSELEESTGLGIFSLSATITDRAEPSESLQATVAWQSGLDAACHLLCSDQVDAFRHGRPIVEEHDIRGKPGAYLVNAPFQLPPQTVHQWHIVTDVNQDSRDVVQLIHLLQSAKELLEREIEEDINCGTANLVKYVAAADGLQVSAAKLTTAHHFANVLFNIMRGGIFAEGYWVRRDDLRDFLMLRNRAALQAFAGWLENLPERLTISELYARAAATAVPDLVRLCYEYLPLTFSRRHGDPSRPWNRFSINTKKMDGSPNMDYQGNWRDIFQNWEPLALSFPDYAVGMVAKFLNATTADGYNPYRVTRAGIEWEVPEPENPWSNIGYWSDHQIIYLQKLLEITDRVDPAILPQLWNQSVFSYANVPYRLRSYPQMLADWYNTIDFDLEKEESIEGGVRILGTDARLVRNDAGEILHVTMAEKLLVLLLAKLVNLVPEGGIWMNTQRPEWNDANNALVGKGLSVVTVAYLYRFVTFWLRQLAESVPSTGVSAEGFTVNTAVADLLAAVQSIFESQQSNLATGFSGETRREMMDALGAAITTYRTTIYESGVPATQTEVNSGALRDFLQLAQRYLASTLQANERADGLYHSYNILHLEGKSVTIEHLYPMLEGQVAMLSSGLLTSDKALSLLQDLRDSELYRPDQHSYILYPNRRLPGFLEKNNVQADQMVGSQLANALVTAGDKRLLLHDQAGVYHFNGLFRNADDVTRALDELAEEPAYAALVTADRTLILALFEQTFNHRAFTGRSGTFFAYEGLGSIYWHMVSKLLLATQECYEQALAEGADKVVVDGLAAAYYDIRQGLGFNKSPAEYGAFPTDPYSHTPFGSGARQPGMTGQVKEEILTRWGELGISIQDGALQFSPTLLQKDELQTSSSSFTYVDVAGETQTISLPPHSLAFTYCQTPVTYTRGDTPQIRVNFADGRSEVQTGNLLDPLTTKHIFDRDHMVRLVQVTGVIGDIG